MTLRIGDPGPVEPAHGGIAPVSVLRPRFAVAAPAPVTADVLPARPPDELAEQVAAAAARAEAMAACNRQLHFEKDPGSGRIVVQVRELDGTVVRTIPPSEALDIMSGHGQP